MSLWQRRQPGADLSLGATQQPVEGKSWVTYLLVALLLIIFAVQAFSSALQKSNIWDESGHLLSGYVYQKKGMDWLEPSHPPFGRMLATVPLLFLPLDDQLKSVHPQEADNSNFYAASLVFLFENRISGERLLATSRLMVILLGVILGLYVYRWALLLYGVKGGLLALFLYSLSPNILAHARLVTTDFPATALAFIAMYHFWSFTRQPGVKRAIAAGLFLGLAFATKYNTLFVLLPMATWALWALVSTLHQDPAAGPPRRIVVRLLTMGVVAYITIWGVYGFRFRSPLYQKQMTQGAVYSWEKNRPSFPLLASAMDGFRQARILPESYIYGLCRLLARGQEGHSSYLMGRVSTTGWWYYFPLAFLFKTPVSTLLLLFATLLFFPKVKEAPWSSLNFLLLPAVVVFFFTSRQHINIGLRHVLPAYPFLLVLTARVVHYKSQHQKLARWILGLLCIWAVWEAALIYPHYLAYFNGLVGGPSGGRYMLVDSNLDWGQDLKGLKSYMERNGIRKVKLAYFGLNDPAYYGIDYDPLPSYAIMGQPICEAESPAVLELKGTMAVSATLLQGLYCPGDFYRILRGREPIANIGYSIYIFQFN
jgi:4-amino-4-deoxy-L-arabinose transferase-like glycosyltransferase